MGLRYKMLRGDLIRKCREIKVEVESKKYNGFNRAMIEERRKEMKSILNEEEYKKWLKDDKKIIREASMSDWWTDYK